MNVLTPNIKKKKFLEQPRRGKTHEVQLTPHKAIAAVWGVSHKAIAVMWGVSRKCDSRSVGRVAQVR